MNKYSTINYEYSYRLQRHSEEILRLKMEELDLMGEDNVADNFLKRLAGDMRSGKVGDFQTWQGATLGHVSD